MLLILYSVRLRIIPPEQTQDLPLKQSHFQISQARILISIEVEKSDFREISSEYVSKLTAICRNSIDF